MLSPEIRAMQIAYAARPFAVRWVDSHYSGTHRFHSLCEAHEYIQDQWARVQRDVATDRYRASALWQSHLETPDGCVQLAYVLLTNDVSSYSESIDPPSTQTYRLSIETGRSGGYTVEIEGTPASLGAEIAKLMARATIFRITVTKV